jgi:hypothetical protein
MPKKWTLEDIRQRLKPWRGVEHAWVLDTEFQSIDGRSRPVCLCAVDLVTGMRIEMFFYTGIAYDNPFTYDNSIFIGFNLAAEWSVFIALGWNLPPKCLDLSFEFKQQTNEKMKRDRETPFVDPYRRKLVHACDYFGVDHLSLEAKNHEQQNIIQYGSFAPPDVPQADYERRVISYCWQDVEMTEALFWCCRLCIPGRLCCADLTRGLLRGMNATDCRSMRGCSGRSCSIAAKCGPGWP